jgi:hypothetical protein
MKETAKALVSKNQNELLAARTIEVSLDRADNVIEGGRPFHTTQTSAFEFPGARTFAPLFHAKGRGLDAAPLPNLRDNHLFKSGNGYRFTRDRATALGTFFSAEAIATTQMSLKALAV